MKRRIIALLMATLSATALFASCGKDDVGGAIKCTNHIDANKDTLCDSCKRAIVTVVEKVEPEKEERVDMVVKAIPTDAKRADYIVETPETATVIANKTFKKNEVLSKGSLQWNTWLVVNETIKTQEADDTTDPANPTPEKYKYSYAVYSKDGATKHYSFASDEYVYGESANKQVGIEFGNPYYYCIEEKTKVYSQEDPTSWNWESKYVALSAAGEKLFESEYIGNNDISISSYGNYTYISFGGKTQIIDNETNKIVKAMDTDYLIKRPAFDEIVGDYGYVVDYDKVWVYNLKGENWVDCVYYAEAPSAWNSTNIYVMQDGKILMQGTKYLSSSAASFDYMIDEAKFDIVQTITDVATKTTTEVEFGYMINSLEIATAEDGYTDKAKNIVSITPVVDDALATNETLDDVIIDNELNILYVYEASLIGQDDSNKRIVAPNLYLTKLVYDEESWAKVLVDGDGKLVAYVPASYEDFGSYLKKGDAYYAWTDLKTPKFTMPEEYNGLVDCEEFRIYSVTTEVPAEEEGGESTTETKYYLLNKFTLEVKEVPEASNHVYSSDELVVYRSGSKEVVDIPADPEVEGSTDTMKTVQVYAFYTANGAFTAEFDTYINFYNGFSVDEETGVWTIRLDNGEVYVG